MCGICNVVNCIRRSLSCSCNSRCNNSGCSDSRYCEPRTNVICANRQNGCFEPCCDDREVRCHKHHCHEDCDCGCRD